MSLLKTYSVQNRFHKRENNLYLITFITEMHKTVDAKRMYYKVHMLLGKRMDPHEMSIARKSVENERRLYHLRQVNHVCLQTLRLCGEYTSK